jgi:hypothetical protein
MLNLVLCKVPTRSSACETSLGTNRHYAADRSHALTEIIAPASRTDFVGALGLATFGGRTEAFQGLQNATATTTLLVHGRAHSAAKKCNILLFPSNSFFSGLTSELRHLQSAARDVWFTSTESFLQ